MTTATFASPVSSPSMALIAAGETYWAQIQARLADLVSQGRYTHAEALVASLASLRSSVYTLPPELLSEIFLWACGPRNADLSWPYLVPSYHRDDDEEVQEETGSLQAAVRLSHVCVSWRKVALETPRLWATTMPIRVPEEMEEPKFEILLQEFLARSRSISFPLLYGLPRSQVLRKHFIANISRVDAMRLLNTELLADMTGTRCPCLENLEYLSLDFARQTQIESGAWVPQTPAFLTARKLARVKLFDTPLASLFLPWAQLTDLDMRPFHTSAAQSFDALRQCTAAVRICVVTACWTDTEPAPSAPHLLPRLEKLEICFTDETGSPEDVENENMTPMFRGLTLPALKDLKLDTIGYIWPAGTQSEFVDFLRRAPHIDTLEFSSEFDAVALRDILAVTPSLRRLSLNGCSKAMEDPVIEYLTYDPSNIQAPSVPQLRILRVDHDRSGWAIDQAKLQLMIESRWLGFLQGLTEDKRAQVSPWEKLVLRTRQRATQPIWTMPFCARIAELKHLGLDVSIS